MKKNILGVYLVLVGLLASCSKDNNSFSGSGTSASTGGSLARFAVVGDYMYCVDHTTLIVLDIKDPLVPVVKKKSLIEDGIETIFPYDGKLFIGANDGMFMYDISTPTNPIKMSKVQHLTTCDPVVANSTHAYVTLRGGQTCRNFNTNELQIYSLSNGLVDPVLIRTIPMSSPMGLGLKDTTLFVCNQEKGLAVFNIKSPINPILKSNITGEIFRDIIVYNNVLICMLADGIAYYDISDVNNIQKLSVLKKLIDENSNFCTAMSFVKLKCVFARKKSTCMQAMVHEI